jgi:hypothetical protein
MRHFVWAAIVALGICAWACGGSSKPPMVPDQPGDPTLVGDGGATMPAPSK